MMPRVCVAIFGAFAAFAVLSLSTTSVQGQAGYPSQAIKLIVPNPAGGLADTVARIIGRRLQERLGQAVLVENRPGGNGSIAAAALATSPADGYTFMVTDGAILSINPLLYARLAYRPQDLAPVALVGRAPLFLAANARLPVGTLVEFVAYARAHPGALNYGSSGLGSTHHLSMVAAMAALGLTMTHIPYKGTSESVPALLGGHVDVLFSSYAGIAGFVRDKRVTLLATNGLQRSAEMPDVPPVADLIPGFDFSVMQGVFAHAGTPADVVARIAAEVAAIVREPDIIRQLAVVGVEPVGVGPEEFAAALRSEIARVADAARAAGIKPQ